jgi:hypothetical protein
MVLAKPGHHDAATDLFGDTSIFLTGEVVT